MMKMVENELKWAKIAQGLFYLIGVIWLGLAGGTFYNAGGLSSGYWVVAVLMVGNGGVLIGLGAGLLRFRKLFFWMGLLVVGVNILLTFTDQFGFWDLLTLLIDIGLFGVLLFNHRFYLRS